MSAPAMIDHVIPSTDVVKRAARIGAEIGNIKLSGDLPDQAIAAINNLLLEHKVLFFRDQGHLDDAEHERFAVRWGTLTPPVLGVAAQETMSLVEIDAAHGVRGDTWHIDGACMDAYPKICVLRGVMIPPLGGDTIWSNAATAYLDLPPPLRRLADDLWAVHSNVYDFAVNVRPSEADKKRYSEFVAETRFETEHPVVRVHPETGERTLVLGIYLRRFVDIPKYDGQKLFDLLESHITAPENTVRWNWKQGDVAMWDNRATMHYAVNDYGDQRRLVRRATIDGEVPVSVDGRRSAVRVKSLKHSPAISSSPMFAL